MVARKLLIILCFVLLIASCGDEFFSTLNRSTADPVTVIPTVTSFLESNTIYISWEADEAADEYTLERAEDSINLIYKEIYKGTSTEYIDRNLPDECRYLYRLSKRRGQKTFPFSDPALGVSTITTRDIYEPNDTEETATNLGYTKLYANLPFYQAYNNLTVCDVDWYYVEIPPQWMADIVIVDRKITENGADTHFMIYGKEKPPSRVKQSDPITIYNYNNNTYPEKFYFKIYPVENLYRDDITGVGGSIVDYTICVSEMRPISS